MHRPAAPDRFHDFVQVAQEDSELILFLAGGNVAMGKRVNVWVESDRDKEAIFLFEVSQPLR